MQKKLKDFIGKEAIFIDANIFLHHAFGTNITSIEFLKKVESLNMKAYTSALVIEEIIFKLIIQSASNFIDRVTLDKVKHLFKESKNREKVLSPVEKYIGYINTLKDLGLGVIDLTGKDIVVALQKVRTYGLMTADAAHIAVMERKGLKHIASSDRDFNVVDNITSWLPD
ncbi:MAG: PIN domain-containing protein [Nitrospirae bacterium]|nr:PIN domain-containing protein [Nitrospirota bacterium]